ncbi:DUF3320 domain-containing protein, partial [Candidatus Skiveiella danica]|uniref:DUF3320 domain-containing protein n=1 Tax=Candidatus Skiveiella danica TaxID=3386177 RepID=UPI0039B8A29B
MSCGRRAGSSIRRSEFPGIASTSGWSIPRAPGRYLLGIECDGRTYHSAATARDRDRLRHLILEGLGWQLHRIWSTDWWRSPAEPMRKILARLEDLLTTEPKGPTAREDGQPDTPPDPVEASAAEVEEVATYAKLVQPEPVAAPKLPVYRVAELPAGNGDNFYDPASRAVLAEQLMRVIRAEGPIADFVLFRRVARAWGLQRTGRRIEELLRALVPPAGARTVEGDVTFYWPETSQPAQWEGFRVADDLEESKRQLDELCAEELGNLAMFILSEHGGTSVSELARSICRLQRIARTSADAEARIA